MTIAELNTLEIGALIPLNVALDSAVDLRVNGRTIAKGELVAIGDKFGVRISVLGP